MCRLSDPDDPTRSSQLDMSYESLRDWLAMISKEDLENGWSYSCRPYHRGRLPPKIAKDGMGDCDFPHFWADRLVPKFSLPEPERFPTRGDEGLTYPLAMYRYAAPPAPGAVAKAKGKRAASSTTPAGGVAKKPCQQSEAMLLDGSGASTTMPALASSVEPATPIPTVPAGAASTMEDASPPAAPASLHRAPATS